MNCDMCGNPISSGTRCARCVQLLNDLKDEDDE
jgi:hypothetical protein